MFQVIVNYFNIDLQTLINMQRAATGVSAPRKKINAYNIFLYSHIKMLLQEISNEFSAYACKHKNVII